MNGSVLLKGVPQMGDFLRISWREEYWEGEEEYWNRGGEEVVDYVIQTQTIAMVMGRVDNEDGWNGPENTAKHMYTM